MNVEDGAETGLIEALSMVVSWWQDVVEKASTKQSGPPALRLSSPGERERHTAMSGGAGEVNMLQYLFGLQLPLTHTTLSNKVRGIFFLKKSSLVFIHCVNMYSACIYVYMYICYLAIQHIYCLYDANYRKVELILFIPVKLQPVVKLWFGSSSIFGRVQWPLNYHYSQVHPVLYLFKEQAMGQIAIEY